MADSLITAEELAEDFGVELGDALGARSVHEVYAARRRSDGRECVLKLVRPGTDWVHKEMAALELQDGDAAVRVLARDERGALLERVLPGTPLSELVAAGRDDEATAILAGVMEAWRRPATPGALADLTLIESDIRRLPGLLAPLPPRPEDSVFLELAEQAAAVLGELLRASESREWVLLHGDLHHDNVLLDEKRGWVAIDPHGLVGPAGYEIGQFPMNPHFLVDDLDDDELAALTRHRLGLAAELLRVDVVELTRWAFVKAVVSEVWWVEDEAPDYTVSLRVARLLAP